MDSPRRGPRPRDTCMVPGSWVIRTQQPRDTSGRQQEARQHHEVEDQVLLRQRSNPVKAAPKYSPAGRRRPGADRAAVQPTSAAPAPSAGGRFPYHQAPSWQPTSPSGSGQGQCRARRRRRGPRAATCVAPPSECRTSAAAGQHRAERFFARRSLHRQLRPSQAPAAPGIEARHSWPDDQHDTPRPRQPGRHEQPGDGRARWLAPPFTAHPAERRRRAAPATGGTISWMNGLVRGQRSAPDTATDQER